MKFDDVYDGMAHTVRKGFSTSKVFGEPIKVNERVTIIPVAKVMMGGGGGGGEESVEDEEKKEEQKKAAPTLMRPRLRRRACSHQLRAPQGS